MLFLRRQKWSWDAIETKTFLVENEDKNGEFIPHGNMPGADDSDAHDNHQLNNSVGAQGGGQQTGVGSSTESIDAGSNSVTVQNPTIGVQADSPQHSSQGMDWNQDQMEVDNNGDDYDEPP